MTTKMNQNVLTITALGLKNLEPSKVTAFGVNLNQVYSKPKEIINLDEILKTAVHIDIFCLISG
jgi:hypothetical protein